MSYDPERNISWDEISPSLRARFKKIATEIYNNSDKISVFTDENKLSIGPKPPSNPEKLKSVWFDTSSGELSLKYYDKNGNWIVTRAAWYGGSTSDVVEEKYSIYDGKSYKDLKKFIYVSNEAVNNTYSAPSDMYYTGNYTIPKTSKYFIRDLSTTFEYNKQKKYEHDGGSIKVQIFHNGTEIMNNTYDSKLKWRALDTDTTESPYKVINCNQNDTISYSLTVLRNPKSTDDMGIYFIMKVIIYIIMDSSINYIPVPRYEVTEF